ncbi:zinc finger protein piragua-like [Chironomus tepperi]|uniref:zinc finger protein piragua-like n=1 Tax=Chironomus tepperi TaxID=113505 RepID=UPI00391F2BFF
MSSICRLCITQTPALTSVFSFKNDHLISDLISLICPVNIDPSDNYPKSICLTCLRIVTEAYELREKSLQSDIKFKSGKIKMSSKNSEPAKSSAPTRSSSTKEPQKLPEVTTIKVEKDPFNSAIEFVDESYQPDDEQYESNESGNDYDDGDDDDDDDDYQEIIPIEPKIRKKSKYERVTVGEITRVKCRFCDKVFSNTQNVKRHMMMEHDSKKEVSTSCKLCGAFISHKTNLKRHIKMHHPEYNISPPSKLKTEHFQEIIKNSSELTRKIFATPKKQKYIEYITITSLENDNNCFKYQCLICMRENGTSKIWSQRINNGGTSNIRRHLSTMHPEDFQRLEDSLNGEGLLPTLDDIN